MQPTTPSCEWSLRRSDGREIPFTIAVGERMILGRDLTVAIPVLESGVSRLHAAFEYDGEELRLEDLQSQNGTLINAVPVEQASVRPGDVITVGGVSFVLGRREPGTADDDGDRVLHHLSREQLLRLASSARELSTPHANDLEHRLLGIALRLVEARRGVVFLRGATAQLRAAAVLPENFHATIARLTTSLAASVSVSARGQLLDHGHAVALPLYGRRGLLYLERSGPAFESSSLDLLRAFLWISAPILARSSTESPEAARVKVTRTVSLGTESS